MKNLLKLNDNIIVREEDKMIFSAQKMQMYKFNDRGFNLVKIICDMKEIYKEDLFDIVNKSSDYTEEEFNNIINKMIKYNIISLEKQKSEFENN